MKCIVIHYDEIGLKKTNRPYFERKLLENIHLRTGLNVRKEYGKLVSDYGKNIHLLKYVPGIAYYSPAVMVNLNIEDIINEARRLIKKGPFRISTKRSNKNFKYTSMEINKIVGDAIDFKVNLSNPKTELFIEIGEKNAYLFTKKYKGLGGLPVGVSGRLISLISGGIDSPVASYEMIRRGCEVVLVHFYNNTQGLKDKIIELAKRLAIYQGKIKLVIIPFKDTQSQVIMNIPSKVRMIIYRRLMIMIAEKLLKKENALGFITGDNVAQVASQTLENLRTIWNATKENIYAPLISYDKKDIINIAKKINTYEISIKPYSDCCSYLVARHPETHSNIKNILILEKKINISKIVNNAFRKREEININSFVLQT